MNLSPPTESGGISSPDVFANVRCNLNSQFLESAPSESMCVYARIRPILPHEEAKGFKECIAAIDEKTVRVIVPETSARYKSSRQNADVIEDYSFTAAYGPETGQFVFFQETVLNSMENFAEGSNSLVFSYGITGSGKTYTLQGNSENPGIIPLSLKLYFASMRKYLMNKILVKPSMYDDIIALSETDMQREYNLRKQLFSLYDEECDSAPGSFRNSNVKSFAMTLCNLFSDDYEMEERQTTLNAEDMASAQAATQLKEVLQRCVENQQGVCSVWISFIEIYNENIFDLLQPFVKQRARLNLGEDKNGNVYVKGVQEVCVFNSDEALKLLNIGRKNLSIASTKMNYQSSRSHCIYTIRTVRVPNTNNLSHGRINRLSFCDLAGSERASKAQTSGMRLKEAGSINASLLVLARCLQQLRFNQTGREKRIIPFRESKLTRLFSGFFTGQGKAVMVANASPSDYTFDETIHVLKFSAVAKKILVNDTFLSAASTTIQSICSQWEMYKNNSSMINESTESFESIDSDVIQQKDEIIEKLLNLADDFAKKEKEMASMEIRIRKEVCEEYAEYSDQLLESKRLIYEEQIEALKQNYQRRLNKMEKMYEDIIKGYNDQFSDSEGEESFISDKTIDLSKSFEKLNDSVEYSTSQSELKVLRDDIEKLKKEALELKDLKITYEAVMEKDKSTICTLNEDLYSKTIEAATAKENMQVQSDKISSLKKDLTQSEKSLEESNIRLAKSLKELNESKTELATLEAKFKEVTEKCVNVQSEKSNLENILESNKQNLTQSEKSLEESNIRLAKSIKELNESKTELATLEAKFNEVTEKCVNVQSEKRNLENILESDKQRIEALINEVGNLEKQIKELNDVKISCTSEIENYENIISSLKHEINSMRSVDVLAQESHTFALEKDLLRHKRELQELKKTVKDHSRFRSLRDSDVEKLQSKVSGFEKDLQVANEKTELVKKELQVRETVASQLEKEVDKNKQEIMKLKEDLENSSSEKLELEKQLSTFKNQNEKYEHDIKDLKNKLDAPESRIAELEKELLFVKNELDVATEEIEKKTLELKKLEHLNKVHELEIDNLKQEKTALEEEFNNKLKVVTTELHETKEGIEKKSSKFLQLESRNKIYEIEIAELKENIKKEQLLASKEIKRLKDKIEMESAKVIELESLSKATEAKNKELQSLVSFKDDLEAKLDLAATEIKSMENTIQQKSSQVAELEQYKSKCELEIDTLKKDKETMLSEKDQFQVKLTAAEDQLATIKVQVQKEFSKVAELEKLNDKYKADIEELQDSLQLMDAEKLQFEEKRALEISELESLTNILQQKSLKLEELENEASKFKEELEILQESQHTALAVNLNLTEKVTLLTKELEIVKSEFQQKNSRILELEDEIDAHKAKAKNLETEINLHKDKIKHEEKLDSAENETEIYQKLAEMEKEISEHKQGLKKLKEMLNLTEQEKQDLMMVVSNNEKKTDDLEEELSAVNEELKNVKEEISKKNLMIENLENNLTQSEKKLEESNIRLAESVKDLNERKTELASLELKHAELIEKFKHVENKKDELENILESEKQNLTQSEKKLEESNIRLAESVKDLNERKTELASLELKHAELVEKFKHVEIKKDELEESEKQSLTQSEKNLEENDIRLAESLKDLHVSKTELASLELKHAELVEKCKDLESVKGELENILESEKQKFEILKDKIEDIRKDGLAIKDLSAVYETTEKQLYKDTITNLKERLSTSELNHTLQLETDSEDLQIMLYLLQMCELKASEKINCMENSFTRQKALMQELHLQITNKETSIEQLEKGLTNSQEQLKEMQVSYENKMVVEKEQHMVEIEETIKLKHQVEEENLNLKNDNLKLREENSQLIELNRESKENKEINKNATLPKNKEPKENKEINKNATLPKLKVTKAQPTKVTTKEKENLLTSNKKVEAKRNEKLPKTTSRRTLRQKQVKDASFSSVDSSTSKTIRQKPNRLQNISFSSIDSLPDTPELPRRNRKRASDEDFDPVKERGMKKMKPTEETKVSMRRTTRRAFQNDREETLSPVQKLANSISTKFKVIAENVSSKIASPRLTRGRKKLYNPDMPSTSTRAEKVTKGKK